MSEEEYKEYKENKKRIYEIERVISEKDAPIENEFSGVDFIFGEGSITKSVTVYYFYSEDGLSVKVDRKTYFSKKVGDVYVGNGIKTYVVNLKTKTNGIQRNDYRMRGDARRITMRNPSRFE